LKLHRLLSLDLHGVSNSKGLRDIHPSVGGKFKKRRCGCMQNIPKVLKQDRVLVTELTSPLRDLYKVCYLKVKRIFFFRKGHSGSSVKRELNGDL
jgi:hypothetical protein